MSRPENGDHRRSARRASAAERLLRRGPDRYRNLAELVPDGVTIHCDGELVWASAAAARLLGAPGPEALLGRPALDFVHPASRELAGDRMRQVLAGAELPPAEESFLHADGSVLTVETSAVPFSWQGRPAALVALRDLTARRRIEESEAKFRTLAETMPAATFISQGGALRYVNPALELLTGYRRAELLGMTVADLLHPDHRDRLQGGELAIAGGGRADELRFLRKDGEARWLALSAGPLEYEGRPARLVTAFDTTERRRAEEQIRDLAFQDALTGLPNRRLFTDRLHMAVAQAHRTDQRLAVFFLDLDHFKTVNDTLGHGAGDQLLAEVGLRLRQAVREGDTVARLGGDEFILLMPGVGRVVDVAIVARKLLEGMRPPFQLGGREVLVTASLGVSVFPDDGEDVDALIRNADTAMYRAKEEGRDGYQLYTRAMNATAMERLALENGLRKAIGSDEFQVHYQPVLDISSGRVHGVEALMRWRHPTLGLVPPSDFIPIAETTGLIASMGPWLLQVACRQAKAWHGNGHAGLSVAVNLSSRQFRQPGLVEQLAQALDESGLQPRFLELEVSETHLMHDAESAARILRELKALGVRVLIDDFGMGSSSLTHLKRLPIDAVKIDKSFVRDIGTDPDDAAVVSAAVAMAHALELAVVAEGVESEEQLAFLAARGCDRMQGYLFAHPMPAAECGELLARHASAARPAP